MSPFVKVLRDIFRIRVSAPQVQPPELVESNKFNIFDDGPAEIVEIIFNFLSHIDRACLALSSKRLHACYVSYNKKHDIGVLSALPRIFYLHRLQNEHWEFCNKCQRLHLRSKWKALHYMKCSLMPSTIPCNAKRYQEPTWYYQYFEQSGVVDICPCLNITFHQRQHAANYFRSQSETLERCYYRELTGIFIHVCTLQHPLARVCIRTQAWINDRNTKTFKVENQLVFQTSKKTASSEVFQNISRRLSKYDTEMWLKQFLEECQPNFSIGEAKSNWYQCQGWDFAGHKPYNFRITVMRDLGRDRKPSTGWEGNCHS
ncbi:hypothetical protein PENSTE_c020G08209 [Penicillium steckii]|uniref:F-box domain-containing protein n=1 Tax=Penicillium steckii TaxID=303698 RepID=A0A1V6SVH1_9EURO|nr:hypothetical protein PENSTE_c020G08209 [Penicillium steckii]